MKKMKWLLFGLTTLLMVSCAKNTTISAGGASFPYPLYEKWFGEYSKQNGVNIDYQSIGSGAGQRKLADELVQFAGSDVVLGKDVREKMKKKGHEVLQFPSIMGAVVVAYHLDTTSKIRLDKEVLADIFLGKITKWNDPRILKDNQGIEKDLKGEITVVHRSDGSGTTAIFTKYLSHVSSVWKRMIGFGKTVKWQSKTAVGAKGNAAVTNTIKSKKGSIGYVSLEYALSSNLTFATLKNESNKWVDATKKTISSSAMGVKFDLKKETDLFNSKNSQAYPLSSVTYLLVVSDLNYMKNTEIQAKETYKLFHWILSDEAQMIGEEMNFVQLPKKLREYVKKEVLDKITFNKKQLKN